ncbi:MAG: aspartyl protease family protein [Cyanobacteria bacterium P01_A01_bin.114]
MGSLVLPSLKGRRMGQVITTIKISNWIDQVLHQRGFIEADEVRSLTLDTALVDTGATLLCLPKAIVEQLGLVQDGVANVETTAGVQPGRIFRDVDLQIGERRGTFDCLELTEVNYPLLGVTPLEILGLEPDRQNRTLRFLPQTPEQTYLSVL